MTAWIDLDNKQARLSKKQTTPNVTEREVAMGHAIILAAPGYQEKGEALWMVAEKQEYKQELAPPNMKTLTGVSFNRFKDLKKYWVCCEDESNKDLTPFRRKEKTK